MKRARAERGGTLEIREQIRCDTLRHEQLIYFLLHTHQREIQFGRGGAPRTRYVRE